MTDVDDILEHFGVKGMKWGVRKARREASSSGDAKTADSARAKIKSAGGTHALTNKELQDLVTRMNLEKQFKNLTPPSKTSAAVKFTSDIVLQVGKQQVAKLASDALAKQLANAMNKK